MLAATRERLQKLESTRNIEIRVRYHVTMGRPNAQAKAADAIGSVSVAGDAVVELHGHVLGYT